MTTDSLFDRLNNLLNIDPDFNLPVQTSSCYYDDSSFNRLYSSDQNLHNMFSAIFLNIRSASKNLESFHNYLHLLNHEFPIIGLAETWLNQDNELLCTLPNYKYHGELRSTRCGGGVCFLVKDHINFKPRRDIDEFSDHLESIFIEIMHIPFNHMKPIIGVIYRPPNTNLTDFLNKLQLILSKLKKEKKPCYLMGDFNLNIINSNQHEGTNQFLDLLYSHSFAPLIDRPTRITDHTSTLIDNIFCNAEPLTHLTGLLYTDISDHLPIFIFNRSENSTVQRTISFPRRRINNNTIASFKDQLTNITWDDLFECHSTEDSYRIFLNKFKNAYDLHFPIIQLKHNNKKPTKPWITPGIKISIRQKNKLYKAYHIAPFLYNKIKYKRYKNVLNNIIKLSKRHYFNLKLEENKSNMKETWRILKEVIGVPNKSSISSTFLINGETVTDTNKIVNCFNDFFVNIGKELASKLPRSNTDALNYIQSNHPQSLFLSPITETEISDCIMRLKQGSPGHDDIKPDVIKQCKDHITKPLAHIFNLSIQQGIVPKPLKCALVTPIFKSGCPDEFNNYRPISVLPCFSKLLERLLFNRLYNYLSINNLLSDNQFGFRKKLSTEMAIITAIDFITEAIDKKEHVIGLFLDLRKAFDTVNKEILIQKLERYGIRGNALKWFHSYLNGRTQKVKCLGDISDEKDIEMGVPQGSILGPLLFILFINDLPNISGKLKAIMFADDTTLFISDKNIDNLTISFNRELSTLNNWFTANKLSLNLGKTHYLLFSSNPQIRSREIDLKINNTPIEKATNTKFLGVQIDDKLSWSQHIDYICSKIRRSIGIIKKASNTLERNTLITLYYSIVFPYLCYCHIVWAKASSLYLDRLFKLQKRVVRIICNEEYLAHTDPLFRACGIIKLNDLYTYFISIFTYKSKHRLFPSSFDKQTNLSFHIPNPITHNTRLANSLVIHTPFCRTSLRQKTVQFQSKKIYNDFLVPLGLINLPSIFSLKKSLKSILL